MWHQGRRQPCPPRRGADTGRRCQLRIDTPVALPIRIGHRPDRSGHHSAGQHIDEPPCPATADADCADRRASASPSITHYGRVQRDSIHDSSADNLIAGRHAAVATRSRCTRQRAR
ncbi:hypothetical protein NX04_12940 [Xanthomonas vasicola]|nr:hypothetical protein NX04_12940 [Xanthomonas vasicola]KGR48315.1 hypothetical protein NX05_00305 [Xanthomonas vasicola]